MDYLLINLGIVAFLFLAWGWDLPEDYLPHRFLNLFRPLILYVGHWHSWSMFSPEPLSSNRRIEALIWLRGGECLTWQPESNTATGFFRRFLLVREVKWLDNLMGGKHNHLRPSLCDYLVHQFRERGHDPERIELIQYRQPVPLPGNTAEPETKSVLFKFQVAPLSSTAATTVAAATAAKNDSTSKNNSHPDVSVRTPASSNADTAAQDVVVGRV